MSRIGRLPIPIPEKVKVTIEGKKVTVEGPKGSLSWDLPDGIEAKVEDGKIRVTRQGDEKQLKALHGLSRALINNMVIGVTQGYEKRLEIVGVGYRASVQGRTVTMNLGFSHPVVYTLPEGITARVEGNNNIIVIQGIDKQKVGQAAAELRSFCPPEPYKGKGIRYVGEQIIRKMGKASQR